MWSRFTLPSWEPRSHAGDYIALRSCETNAGPSERAQSPLAGVVVHPCPSPAGSRRLGARPQPVSGLAAGTFAHRLVRAMTMNSMAAHPRTARLPIGTQHSGPRVLLLMLECTVGNEFHISYPVIPNSNVPSDIRVPGPPCMRNAGTMPDDSLQTRQRKGLTQRYGRSCPPVLSCFSGIEKYPTCIQYCVHDQSFKPPRYIIQSDTTTGYTASMGSWAGSSPWHPTLRAFGGDR